MVHLKKIVPFFLSAFLAASSVFFSYNSAVSASSIIGGLVGSGMVLPAGEVLAGSLAGLGLFSSADADPALAKEYLDNQTATRQKLNYQLGSLIASFLKYEYESGKDTVKFISNTVDGVVKYTPVVVGVTTGTVARYSKDLIKDWAQYLLDSSFFSFPGSVTPNVDGYYWQSLSYDDVLSGTDFTFHEVVSSAADFSSWNETYTLKGEFKNDYIFLVTFGTSVPINFSSYRFTAPSSASYVQAFERVVSRDSKVETLSSGTVLNPAYVASVSTWNLGSISSNLPIFSSVSEGVNFYSNGGSPLNSMPVDESYSYANQSGYYSISNERGLSADTNIDDWLKSSWVGQAIDNLSYNLSGAVADNWADTLKGTLESALPVDIGQDLAALNARLDGLQYAIDADYLTGAKDIPDALDIGIDIPATGTAGVAIPGIGSVDGALTGSALSDALNDAMTKVQEGATTATDTATDTVIDGYPTVDNIPAEGDLSTFADGFFDWAFPLIQLPSGLFDKIPFSIPYDLYLLLTSLTISGASECAQYNPSSVGVIGVTSVSLGSYNSGDFGTAPIITGNIYIPLGNGVDLPIYIDCSQYDYFAKLVYFSVAIGWTVVILIAILNAFRGL